MDLKILPALMEEISRLQEADELLGRVFADCGPYGSRPITNATLYALQRYMQFDDSE